MKELDEKYLNEKKRLEERVKKKPNIKQKIRDNDETTRFVKWVENIIILIQNYGFKRILQALFLIASCVIFGLVVKTIHEEDMIKEMLIYKDKTHEEASQVRKTVDPKIVKTLTRMVYNMEADRACILEMHNGKENPTSLPFLYCDMTYEETKDNIPYIAEEYENLNMSKFQFPSFLYKNKVFYGSIEEIMGIDKKIGMRLEMNEVKYIGMVLIRTTVDIGFLTISWREEPIATRNEIIADLTYYVQEIGTYLDYEQYMKINQ